MYRLYIKSRSDTLLNRYIRYTENKLQTIIRQSEKQFYSAKIDKFRDNVLMTWKVLNEMINKKPVSRKIGQTEIDGSTVENPEIIANTFNNFSTNIGPDLQKPIPTCIEKPSNYLKHSVTNSMFLSPTTDYEISDIIANLKQTNSLGYDGIPLHIIKASKSELSRIHVSEMCVRCFCFHFSVCLTIWFKFWVIIFAMYLPSIATVSQNMAVICFAWLNLFEKNSDSRFNFSIGPGLISLLHLDLLQ